MAFESLNWIADEIPSEPVWPEGVLAMNSAENWLCCPYLLPLIKQAIAKNLEAGRLSYNKNLGGAPDLLENIAMFFNKFLSPRHPIRAEHIVCGAGAGSILNSLDFALSELDEGVLIDAPIWEGFGIASNLRNDDRLIPVTKPDVLSSPEQLIQLYLEAMEAAPSSYPWVSNATAVIGSSLFSDLLVLEHIVIRNRMLLRNAAELIGDFLFFHRFIFYRPAADVFIWTRLGGESATKDSDAELMRSFASAKVSVASGVPFQAKDCGWFRITFTLPHDALIEGLSR
ncbi:hypothetical protein F53441_247 [Fusarium austroafricanum]|uniref:Aminotransferase class I/classII large domain-containing protein n=1 Tax=Fusarium austroafricanum TaxID=2364996 RepID=A0A8H4KYC7_9HYPO|nr:hypothetical protein F53441_247 [Fusarium austroafricanum]